MSTETVHTVTVVVSVPLAKGAGERAVAVWHENEMMITRQMPGAALFVEQWFTRESAGRLARRVMAGDENAMTHPDTLRILAAEVMIADADLDAETAS